MAKFVKGDVVVLPFPFSDLSGSKKRPAFVITPLPGNDILLCQITSKASKDKYSIPITSIDFATGSLPVDSYLFVFLKNKLLTSQLTLQLLVRRHNNGYFAHLYIEELLNGLLLDDKFPIIER